jgi:hypothetical protein
LNSRSRAPRWFACECSDGKTVICFDLMRERERKEGENEKKRCRNDAFHRCYGYWYTEDKGINAVEKSWC